MSERFFKIMKIFNSMAASGGVVGGYTGFISCKESKEPMIHERLSSACLLGISWAGSFAISPVIIPYNLLAKYENSKRGKETDIFEFYKYQKYVATKDHKNLRALYDNGKL